jgi:ribosomal protein S12
MLAVGVAGLAPAAHAQGNQKSVQNEAQFVKFDEATSTVVVKILKKGKGNSALLKQFDAQLKNGKETTFNVIPTGSVLSRTSVAVNGMKGEMKDLKPGKTILIYWVEDPKKKGELFARKIDVVLSEEEQDKRSEDVE